MTGAQRIDSLGEAGILERLAHHFTQHAPVVLGPGDDAAVIAPSGPLVCTTDAIVENIDFIVGRSSGMDVGRKLAVQNLADVACMGARPTWLLYTAMLPGHTGVDLLEQIAAGIQFECDKHQAAVIGGDLGTARDITLSVTAMGALEDGRQPCTRSGARLGDAVILGAPSIGLSAAGLAIILAEHEDNVPDLSHVRDIAERARRWHVAPEPDVSLGYRFGHLLSSMIDVSDGLVRDARRIALSSGVSINLESSCLASDAALLEPLAHVFETETWQWVLGSGEEHAMLATVDPSTWESDESLRKHFRRIGTVGEAPEHADYFHTVFLDHDVVSLRGFDHFE